MSETGTAGQNVVATTTGSKDMTELAATLAGMLFGPTVADFTLGRVTGWDPAVNTFVLGAAGAYFAPPGHLRRAAQGAALIGAVEFLRAHVAIPGVSAGGHNSQGEAWTRV